MIRHVRVQHLWRKPGGNSGVYSVVCEKTDLWHASREPKVTKTGIPFVIDENIPLVFFTQGEWSTYKVEENGYLHHATPGK